MKVNIHFSQLLAALEIIQRNPLPYNALELISIKLIPVERTKKINYQIQVILGAVDKIVNVL